jgi:hypothetical protein
MKLDFDALSCVILPSIGYVTMIWMKKRAMESIKLKVYAIGIYRFKPVYGDQAIVLARSYARGGVIIFVTTIILPLIFFIIKHLV